MQVDGITLSAVVREIHGTFAGARIDRIQSPSRDSVLLHVGRGKAGMVIISASPHSARIHAVASQPSSLPEPPPFCMILRKYLVGGRIVGITQAGLERVVEVEVTGWADEDESQHKRVIVEVMGKRSNIILVDASGTILDAARRVDESLNRYRQILPGLPYISPPPLEKLNPLGVEEDAFLAGLERYSLRARADGGHARDSVSDALSATFAGFSPATAAELAFRAGIDSTRAAVGLTGPELSRLWESFRGVMQRVRAGEFEPAAAFDRSSGKPVALSVVGLSHLAGSCEIKPYPSPSSMLAHVFSRAELLERLDGERRMLAREVSTLIARSQRKLATQEAELLAASDASSIKRAGDLLTANLHALGTGPLGKESVTVVDYYDPGLTETRVEVDPALTASENAQAYFLRYARARRAQQTVAANVEATRDELAYLESVRAALDMAESPADLGGIREELRALGYVRQEQTGARRRSQAHQGRSGPPGAAKAAMPAHYQDATGHDIYVGRNNLQNDHLTGKLARDADLWLHAKDVPGSHVVIRRRPGQPVPDETIYAAALLAAYYSRARMSSKVAVDYTDRRHVRKPRGAKPGMVIYDNHRTVWVTPSREELQRALGLSTALPGRDQDSAPVS
ncbi:MAG: NFACT family protein [Firmicutes bacterium]|jgi:predicted ribosome quality control (RQC) complex YloA/Tae2 family protein|nr:NFACT family protein [Bacillota bacterium]